MFDHWNASVSAAVGTVWLPIENWPYEVSSAGEVRRAAAGHATHAGRPLKPHTNRRGYQTVSLCRDGEIKTLPVHALVAAAFHGSRPSSEHQTAHRDCNPAHNRASNLRWATPQENRDDTTALDRHVYGSRHPKAKLAEDDIPDIRWLRGMGCTLQDIADSFGVTKQKIWQITTGRDWRHVQ